MLEFRGVVNDSLIATVLFLPLLMWVNGKPVSPEQTATRALLILIVATVALVALGIEVKRRRQHARLSNKADE